MKRIPPLPASAPCLISSDPYRRVNGYPLGFAPLPFPKPDPTEADLKAISYPASPLIGKPGMYGVRCRPSQP